MTELDKSLSDVFGIDYTPVVIEDKDKQVILHQTESVNPDAYMYFGGL